MQTGVLATSASAHASTSRGGQPKSPPPPCTRSTSAPLEASVEPDGSAADAYDAAFELYVARGRALFVPQ